MWLASMLGSKRDVGTIRSLDDLVSAVLAFSLVNVFCITGAIFPR